MLNLAKARELAATWIRLKVGDDMELADEQTLTKPYGWVFFYRGKSEPSASNAPFLILSDGNIRVFGTAYPVTTYLREYEAKNPWRPVVPGQVFVHHLFGPPEKYYLLRWHKQVGDPVKIGDVIATIDTPTMEFEVEAFQDGIVTALLQQTGAEIPDGTCIARISAHAPEVPRS